MTHDEFILLLKQFAERPMPSTAGRHIYVWQGALSALTSKAPRGLMTVLDLHDLCHTLERTPSTLEAGRKVLVDAISKWLGREFPRDDQQRALAVTGCDLLMRYSVPLSQFVQLASESRMIALVVPTDESHKRTKPLPAYVRLQADAISSYCKSHLTDEAVIGG